MNKVSICNMIRALIEDMADAQIDSRHVPRRNRASMMKHLGTLKPMEADAKRLAYFYYHLRERRDGHFDMDNTG